MPHLPCGWHGTTRPGGHPPLDQVVLSFFPGLLGLKNDGLPLLFKGEFLALLPAELLQPLGRKEGVKAVVAGAGEFAGDLKRMLTQAQTCRDQQAAGINTATAAPEWHAAVQQLQAMLAALRARVIGKAD